MTSKSRMSQGRQSAASSEVEALADVLEGIGLLARDVAEYDSGQWHMAALAAEVQDPSKEAQAMVVRRLREREDALDSQETRSPGEQSCRVFDRWLRAYRDELGAVQNKRRP